MIHRQWQKISDYHDPQTHVTGVGKANYGVRRGKMLRKLAGAV
jgi:hypothetical protein